MYTARALRACQSMVWILVLSSLEIENRMAWIEGLWQHSSLLPTISSKLRFSPVFPGFPRLSTYERRAVKNYPANRTSRLRNDIINDNIMNYRFKNGNVIQRHKRHVCDFVASGRASQTGRRVQTPASCELWGTAGEDWRMRGKEGSVFSIFSIF